MGDEDEIARYNRARWQALADVEAPWTRAALDLDAASTRQRIDPEGLLGDVAGKDVLCLAGGGGQQGPAFALLGARVTVFDLSPTQLARDREAAAHYQVPIRTVLGDMRDLSPLAPASQDVVYQPYSLGFVPDASAVFAQVARVLRPGGIYFFAVANPFTCGLSPEDWTGDGYALRLPYVPGAMVTVPDPDWVYARGASIQTAPPPSREYRHTLGTLLNGLTERGFRLVHLSDSKDFHADPDAEPGTWGHFVSVAPPWLAFWLRREPR